MTDETESCPLIGSPPAYDHPYSNEMALPNGLALGAEPEVYSSWFDASSSYSLSAELELEKESHAKTLLALQVENQKSKELEGELCYQKNMAANWAAAYQRCSGQLRQCYDEKKSLETRLFILSGRIQRLENKEKFNLDTSAPKERQIQVLRRKLSRLNRILEGSSSTYTKLQNGSKSSVRSPTSEYSQSSS